MDHHRSGFVQTAAEATRQVRQLKLCLT
jgi:hypothetical protein